MNLLRIFRKEEPSPVPSEAEQLRRHAARAQELLRLAQLQLDLQRREGNR